MLPPPLALDPRGVPSPLVRRPHPFHSRGAQPLVTQRFSVCRAQPLVAQCFDLRRRGRRGSGAGGRRKWREQAAMLSLGASLLSFGSLGSRDSQMSPGDRAQEQGSGHLFGAETEAQTHVEASMGTSAGAGAGSGQERRQGQGQGQGSIQRHMQGQGQGSRQGQGQGSRQGHRQGFSRRLPQGKNLKRP